MTARVLVLNVGSGTVGCALFDVGERDPDAIRVDGPIWRATCIRHTEPAVFRRIADGPEVSQELAGGLDDLADAILNDLSLAGHVRSEAVTADPGTDPDSIVAVVHRIVHGGPHLVEPTVIGETVRQQIEDAARWAPLHGASAMGLVDDFADRLPDATPIAVFDTAFHHTIPDWAAVYGGPFEWFDRGFRRYGFHGISVEDSTRRAETLLSVSGGQLRLVIVHLGGGCSVTGVRDGRSVDTTMGFTPTDGLLMAERSGSVDPGLLMYLMTTDGLGPSEVDHLLNHEAGLSGLSGISGDLGHIAERARQGHDRARLAYQAYCHAVRKAIGSMAASTGGIDALIFTGSAIEDQPSVRADLCEGLEYLAASVLVIEADEERAMASAAVPLLEERVESVRAGTPS